ncbi:MAG: hypothetical protein IKY96_03830 [Oscillospiraceae bacterium]|nr:hypothetical protein [Oscillospiraceae bacterium]
MKKSKLTSIALSLVIAFGLWLYVVTNVSQEADYTIYNVPVVMEGETVLTERNLMITSVSADDVDLTLSGNRSDLAKVSSGNTILKVDLTKIYEPGEKIALNYNPVFPSDVPTNALTIQNRHPANIYITVEARRTKEVPVEVVWIGSTPDGFMSDRENRVLDYSSVTVVGPASVADLIEKAVIEVDLSEQKESLSQDYRYTLCDTDGNPVDAELITTNVESIRLDVKIHKVKEVKLIAEVIYGGGATEKNTTVEIEPAVIRLSGGSAVLEELGDSINVGKIDLRTIEKSQEINIPITLPEAVTNLSNITEAKVNIRFTGLLVKEFEVDTIEAVNVPEGLEVEIMEKKMTVALRGTAMDLSKILPEDIIVRADFTGAVAGTSTFKATVHFADDLSSIGAIRSYSVTANLTEKE